MAIIEGTAGNDRISTTRTVPGQPFLLQGTTTLTDSNLGYYLI